MSNKYTPFIIASLGRSGTHLLGTALANHPACIWRYEAFNGGPNSPYGRGFSAKQVLECGVFRDYPPKIRAVGFSLLDQQGWGACRKLLNATAGLKVLLLRRENLLRRYLSRRIAMATGRWQRWNADEPTTSLTVEVEPNEVMADMEEMQRRYDLVAKQFAGCESCVCSYESIRDDFHPRMAELQTFLDLEVRELRPATHRQETRAVRDIVINYDELAARLAGTEWAEMLN